MRNIKNCFSTECYIIPAQIVRDMRISREARGLLLELICAPENSKTTKEDLQYEFCDRKKLNKIFRELQNAGYIKIVEVMQDSGEIEAELHILSGNKRHQKQIENIVDIKKVKHQKYEKEIKIVLNTLNDWINDFRESLGKPRTKGYNAGIANSKLIRARLIQGYTVNDLIRVAGMKFNEWKTDERMKKYIRPATLFNEEKFGSYYGNLPVLDDEEENDEMHSVRERKHIMHL